MSLVNLGHFCSHMQNASRARLSITSIQPSKLHLGIALALQDQGFISSVTRGDTAAPDVEETPTTQENIATRRLWLSLKYHDNEPVLSKMKLVSKPQKKIHMGVQGLQKIAAGKQHNFVQPLEAGEIILLSTDRGIIMEVRQAIERRIGGQLLCRVR
ncbi:ribosomal protein S8 [Choiromyces venosus 120613-1]|uniref:Ribosomal protein S8 n=1 Tax=Choiromyces venosus 120613-1 TaxID=1336337 RepID=A0A3N4JJE2_9PEZI|nr:ribosomal protein S8 [Choiromyces venosus 120613-1]